jgi:hypothetical protein
VAWVVVKLAAFYESRNFIPSFAYAVATAFASINSSSSTTTNTTIITSTTTGLLLLQFMLPGIHQISITT